MTLFINCCPRPESRTMVLAKKVLENLKDDYSELNLFSTQIRSMGNNAISYRDNCIANADYSDVIFDYAKQFKQADTIVIAAPFWDLSFPSMLKCYIENICVNGLTFYYTEHGPKSLCKVKRLIYVTTAGGFIPEDNCGYNYIKQVFSSFFGVTDSVCYSAEGLDIYGADVNRIMAQALKKIDKSMTE